MALVELPQRVDGATSTTGIGRDKSDAASAPVPNLDTQLPSVEFNQLADFLIDVCSDVGIDGAAPGVGTIKEITQFFEYIPATNPTGLFQDTLVLEVDAISTGPFTPEGASRHYLKLGDFQADLGIGGNATGFTLGSGGFDSLATPDGLGVLGSDALNLMMMGISRAGGQQSNITVGELGGRATDRGIMNITTATNGGSRAEIFLDSRENLDSKLWLTGDELRLVRQSSTVKNVPESPGTSSVTRAITLDPNGDAASVDTLGSFGSSVNQSSHGFTTTPSDIPVPFHFNGTDWEPAQNNTKPADGFLFNTPDASTLHIIRSGRLYRFSHGLTVGDWYYVAATAGTYTNVKPGTNPQIAFRVVEGGNLEFYATPDPAAL